MFFTFFEITTADKLIVKLSPISVLQNWQLVEDDSNRVQVNILTEMLMQSFRKKQRASNGCNT